MKKLILLALALVLLIPRTAWTAENNSVLIHGTCERDPDQQGIWTISGTADLLTRLD